MDELCCPQLLKTCIVLLKESLQLRKPLLLIPSKQLGKQVLNKIVFSQSS